VEEVVTEETGYARRVQGYEQGKSSRSEGAVYGGQLPPGGGGGVMPDVTPTKEVAEMDKREHDSYSEARIAEIMGG